MIAVGKSMGKIGEGEERRGEEYETGGVREGVYMYIGDTTTIRGASSTLFVLSVRERLSLS